MSMGAKDMQCAEIYGHVYWIQACDCVDAATGQANNITVAAPRTGAANLYFSVPAFVVLFRESLEVVIVLAIILQFLQKMKQDGMLEESMYYKFRREVTRCSSSFVSSFVCGLTPVARKVNFPPACEFVPFQCIWLAFFRLPKKLHPINL